MAIHKLIIVTLLILLPSLVLSATLDRRDTLRVVSFRQAGLDVSGNKRIDETAANLYLNMAIMRVSADFSKAVEKHRIISLSDGVPIYLIDTLFDSLLFCVYKNNKGVRKSLRKVSSDLDWEIIMKGKIQEKDLDETTFPPEYVMVSGDSLIIYPAPKYDDTLEISYSVIGKKLTHDTLKTDIRPAYRDLIVLWTAYLMLIEQGKYEQAAFFRAEYDLRYARSQRIVQPWELVQ